MKNVLFIFAFLLILANCDEIDKIFNPSSDEYLIDKTISVSTTEQVVESGTEFKMIFPANSVSGDITLKIKKEGSYPAFTVPDAKLGSNTYRIIFSGITAFSSPVKIIINYDKSQIPDGKTAAEIIQAYIYANGNWKLANYQLDELNSKIIISISNLETPKTNKDMPDLQGEGEILIGNSILDQGQNDNGMLSTFRYYFFHIPLISCRTQKYDDGSLISDTTTIGYFDLTMLSTVMKNKSKWINKQFSINFDTTAPGYKWKYDVTFKLSDDLKSIKELSCFYDRSNFYGYTTILTSQFRIQFKCYNIPFSHIEGGDYFYFIKNENLNSSFIIDFFTDNKYSYKGILEESNNYTTLDYNSLYPNGEQDITIIFEKD